jgi:hypothetical protein
MNEDEIILFADASGLSLYGMGKDRAKFIHYLEAFAKLVAAKERKEWAQEFAEMGEWTCVHIMEMVDKA